MDAMTVTLKMRETIDENNVKTLTNAIVVPEKFDEQAQCYSGTPQPIAALFLYVFTPFSGERKQPIFIELHHDGHARQQQHDNLKLVSQFLEKHAIHTEIAVTDGDPGNLKGKVSVFDAVMKKYNAMKVT